MGERLDPISVVVETGHQVEFLPTRCQKDFSAANADFFQRLQVVDNEGGTGNDEAFDASSWQLLQHLVGIRSQPR